MSKPLVVSFGGGVNSTAMLVGLHERDTKPDLILFADPGSEYPETYKHVEVVSSWCVSIGFPAIVTVRRHGETLESRRLSKQMLPSIAYGRRSCSEKFKRRPQDAYVRAWPMALDAWAHGEKITRAIGFDWGEVGRARFTDISRRFEVWYPLIDWRWARPECVAAITRAGLAVPRKSSCFFCPSSRKSEVLALADQHPDLFARAVAMESNAKLQTIAGLGRRFSWRNLVRADDAQARLFDDSPGIPCACFDGDSPTPMSEPHP